MTALSASIYAADPFRLAEEIDAISSNVESFHLDVMDGIFAPEYGLTTRLVRDLKNRTSVPLDVHLMVAQPKASAIRFSEMGVRSVAIHVEAAEDFAELTTIVRSNGARAYAALRHTTPVEALNVLLDQVDGCLFLTAPAGGGAFDEHAFDRLSKRPKGLHTIVDGKIAPDHFQRLGNLQVDVAVIGAALFFPEEVKERAEAFSTALRSKSGA